MSLLYLPHLPRFMAIVDNQGQKKDAPRALSSAEIVRRMSESKPRHNRTLAEAMRIAAQADAEIQGRELAIERMIHSNDSIAHQHDIEHERAAKTQGIVTHAVNVSTDSNCNCVNDNELQNNSTDCRSAEGGNAVDLSGNCDCDVTDSIVMQTRQSEQSESDHTQAHPTGTPKSEPTPPYSDASLSDLKTTPHREKKRMSRYQIVFNNNPVSMWCKNIKTGEVLEFLEWTGKNCEDVFNFYPLKDGSIHGFNVGGEFWVSDYKYVSFESGTFLIKDSEDNVSGYSEVDFNKLFVRL